MIDPVGSLITEIRDYLDGHGITDRVRSPEPAPPITNPTTGVLIDQGDARAAGKYVRFVVLVPLDIPPDYQLPITDARIAFRAYGTAPHDAFIVYAGVVSAIHNIGQRVKANRLGIYNTFVESGGATERDPATQQPYVTGVIQLIATTQAVA